MTNPSPATAPRLAYIDWMRGLACVLMIQAHCYDSWLNPQARKTLLYRWSQEASTLPAPIFLFLAGVSFALVTEGLWQKNFANAQIFRTALLRGVEILGYGILLRIQEFIVGFPKSPWTDLFRVDVLNILGIAIMLMAVFWRLTRPGPQDDNVRIEAPVSIGPAGVQRRRYLAIPGALLVAAVIALVTPPLWTTHRPSFLPWMLESYINGVHIFNAPQPWLFAIFPWCGFAFVGLAFGLFIFTQFAQRRMDLAVTLSGVTGALACLLSMFFDASPLKLYAVYDYWHSNPNFFLMRCGILLILLFVIYAWCRWGLAGKGFSIFMQLGRTSLLVYWAHIEFVYGRLSILPKGRSGIPLATAGMVAIFAAMLGISIMRTSPKKCAAMRDSAA